MRRFELTISDHLPDDAPLPETFRDWIIYLFGTEPVGARTAVLERVVEVRHPPADDIVRRRIDDAERNRRSGFAQRLY